MRIKNMRLSVIFKLSLVIAAAIAILIQVEPFSGNPRWSALNYYTLMTNVLCLVYFFAAMIYEGHSGGTLLPTLKGAVVLGITITGLVFHFLLSGSYGAEGAMAWSNILLHYIVPIMSVMDWLLFSDKGHYSPKSPFLWILLPDVYFVYVQIRVMLGASLGSGGNRYIYPFINVDALGWGKVIVNGLVLNLFFILLGFLFVLADKLVARKVKL